MVPALLLCPCLQPGGGSGLASLLGPARLASLLPKLYRLCHDPSPKVRMLRSEQRADILHTDQLLYSHITVAFSA